MANTKEKATSGSTGTATSGQAARSTQINIINGTQFGMLLTAQNLEAGVWNGGPVQTFPAYTSRTVAQNDSDGIMTGDEGSLTYNLLDASLNVVATINLSWNNPYIGSCGYSCSFTPSPTYGNELPATGYINYSGGGGDNAAVYFVVCCAANGN